MKEKANVEKKIEELRVIEGSLQNLLAQKQSLQLELNEVKNALSEIDKTSDDVYKIVAGVMLRAAKDKLKQELGEREKTLKMRIEAIEKQEKLLEKKTAEIRREINLGA
ncbi:prefoldin subunit beta [Candidatus Pacearchaeota archaeon]|nr:MAG: prefoldin subunit beta [Candidatus Pacearchaeota archaeon]